MRTSAILSGVFSLCACARHGEPRTADDSDALLPVDTSHTDVVDTDPPVDSGHTDPEDTDPVDDTDTWRWGQDNDADDADATLVGTTGEFAGACLLGVDDVDGNGGDDLLVAAPYADEHRGRVYLVSGRSGGWSPVVVVRRWSVARGARRRRRGRRDRGRHAARRDLA